MRSANGSGYSGDARRTYDNDLRLASSSVNAQQTVSYSYDQDSLLMRAGDLNLTRSAQNGLLTGSSLNNLTTSLTHSSFGELSSQNAVSGPPYFGPPLLSQLASRGAQLHPQSKG